jgi:fructokinase
MTASNFRIGFDIGGTKISCCVLAADGKYAFKPEQISTPKNDYASFLRALKGLLDDARKAVPGASNATIGLGTPGEIDITSNTVKNANSIWLNGKDLEKDLQQTFGQEVRIANDAQCLSASEAQDGAAQGAKVAFGVILGTGVGGGVALNGEPWRGTNRLAGEWGHNPFPNRANNADPVKHFCGKAHCIETVLSGPAFSAAYKRATGDDKTPTDIAALADVNHAPAIKALDEYIDRLAEALATIVNTLDPEVIVLGGGVSKIDALYRDLPQRIANHMFHSGISEPVLVTKIVKSKWGPDSGVRGAARLWPLRR